MAETKQVQPAESSEDVLAPVTFESLQETHKDKAAEVYGRIAQIGGFGDVGNDFYGGRPALDINGLNEVVKSSEPNSAKAKDAKYRLSEIKKLLK